MILETNLFWILTFVTQIIILNFIALKFHNYLFFLTGVGFGGGKLSQKLFAFIFFLGTLIHELSHILMAAILFVRVKSLNLKSEITEDRHIKLGSAEVELVDPFRNALIGIAPLIFGIIIIYFLAVGIDLQNFTWLELFKLLLISQISNTMFLSKSDTIYFKYVFFLIIILGIIFWFLNLYFNLLDISTYLSSVKNFFNGSNYVSFLKNLNLVFLSVIFFNFSINLVLKYLSKYKRY